MGGVSYAPLIRGMTWSYSRIKTFESCPYRWYLKYIRRLKGETPLFFSDYGRFVHGLLADFYAGRKSSQDAALDYLINFKEQVPAPAPSARVFASYFEDGLNCLRHIAPMDGEVLAVEQRVRFSAGGRPFLGYIDLIIRGHDGELAVIDHKSKKLRPRSGGRTPAKADRELDDYLRQLYLYAVPVRELYGVYPARLCLHCFRTGIMVEEPFRRDGLEAALDWASAKMDEIEEETEFPPDIEYFKCNYLCEMRD